MKPEEVTVIESKKAKQKPKYIVLENAPDKQFDELPRALFGRMVYYDFKHVTYISNCGMARLIERVKSHLKNGIETKLINISPDLMPRFESLGLDQVIHCNKRKSIWEEDFTLKSLNTENLIRE